LQGTQLDGEVPDLRRGQTDVARRSRLWFSWSFHLPNAGPGGSQIRLRCLDG